MTKNNNGGSRKSIKQGKGYLRGEAEMEALASGRGKAGSDYAQKKIGQIQEARRDAAAAYRDSAEGKARPARQSAIEVKPAKAKEFDILEEYIQAAEVEKRQKNAGNDLFEQYGKLATGFYIGGATKAVSSPLFPQSIPPETDSAKRHKPCALMVVRGAEVESPYTRKSFEWDLSRYRGYTDEGGNLTTGDVKTVKVKATVAQMAALLRDWEQGAKQGGSYKQTKPGGGTAVHHSDIDPYRSAGSLSRTLSENLEARGLNF